MLSWGELIEGMLLQRVNRFLALVEMTDTRRGVVTAHRAFVAKPGRMVELMVPGSRVYLAPVTRAEGHSQFDLKLVDHDGVLVSVDTRVPNDLLHRALLTDSLAEFRGHVSTRREVPYETCRFDFALSGPVGPCLIEAKSVTLVKDRKALFPDAPTERGARHMDTLRQAVGRVHRCAVIFVIQREDADSFSPHDSMDPNFGRALREAMSAGVEAYAYRCKVDLEGIQIAGRVPIEL